MINKANIEKTNAWPFVEAKKILKERKKFIEQKKHSKDFTSSLEKMDAAPAGFVYDLHEKLIGEKIPDDDIRRLVMQDSDTLAMKLKLYYNRPRPYQLAPHHGIDIKYNDAIQKGTASTPSYPSGHTLSAYFAAFICSNMYPAFKNQFLQAAKMVADSRIYEGVHFPSDNDFSIYLAEKVLAPAFFTGK